MQERLLRGKKRERKGERDVMAKRREGRMKEDAVRES